MIPMHAGFLPGPLCPLDWCPSLGSPVPLMKFQIARWPSYFEILRVQEKGTQVRMSECRQSFTLPQNMGWGFLLCPISPTHGTVNQPLYVQMPSQGVMCGKKAGNYPGLYSVKRNGFILASFDVDSDTSKIQTILYIQNINHVPLTYSWAAPPKKETESPLFPLRIAINSRVATCRVGRSKSDTKV
jgi:hypothetical protein